MEFQGENLIEALEIRQMNSSELADQLGATKQAVSGYTTGSKKPSPRILTSMMEVLELPKRFFFKKPTPANQNPAFSRSLLSEDRKAVKSARRKLGLVQEIFNYFTRYFEFPDVKIPKIKFPKQSLQSHLQTGTEQSYEEIEKIATEAREKMGLGSKPISNAVRLLENHGVVLAKGFVDSKKLDGLSQWTDEGVPFIFLAIDKGNSIRSRFDVFHEFGHLVMHSSADESAFFNNKAHFREMENQAHRFASSFLMPEKDFLNDLPSNPRLDDFLDIKSKWKCSIQSMIYRCRDLGVFNKNDVSNMYRQLCRRGWKEREPLDDETLFEEPTLFRQCIEVLMDENSQFRFEIFHSLPYGNELFEELTSLPEGYFREIEDREMPKPILKKKLRGG